MLKFLLSPGAIDAVDVDGATALLESFDGSQIVIEVKSAEIRGKVNIPLEAPGALFDSRPEWTLEELASRNLPREWNREWFLEQWFTHKSLEAIHIATGRPVGSLVKFADIHRVEDELDEYIALLWKRGGFKTFSELARHLKVSTSTVSRVLGRTTKHEEKIGPVREALAEVVKRGKFSQDATVREVVKLLHAQGDKRSHDRIATLIHRITNEPAA